MTARGPSWGRTGAGVAVGALAIGVVSVVILLLKAYVPVQALAGLYLLAMLPVAVGWGLIPALTMAVASMLVYDFFFTPPLFHLTPSDPYTLGTIVISAVTAFVVSGLAVRLRHRAEEAESLGAEQAALRSVAPGGAGGAPPAVVFSAVAEEAGRLLGADVTLLRRYEPAGEATVVGAWSGEDASGAEAVMGDASRHAALEVPIEVEGHPWGMLVLAFATPHPVHGDIGSRLAGFAELVATAIANAENRNELIASRARIVATADATRRRIERDLHDGTQQRLIALVLLLRTVEAAIPPEDGRLRARLEPLAAELAEVIDELRATTQGIHPAALIRGGLGPALGALARRSAVPVELQVQAGRRLPQPVEVAVYYVISEALTNVTKHAGATSVHIQVAADDDVVRVDFSDDGRGGARFDTGSGLVGMKDRVEALRGRLSVRSPLGEGTHLRISLPLTDAGVG
jgi:signal transduction histidine kinase